MKKMLDNLNGVIIPGGNHPLFKKRNQKPQAILKSIKYVYR